MFSRYMCMQNFIKLDAAVHELSAVHRFQTLPYTGCLVISAQFTLDMCAQPNTAKKVTKPLFWGFKVVQGHRCWYPRKARQQCLLWDAESLCLSATVLVLDWSTVAETARFEGGTQIWCQRTENSLNLGGSKHILLKSTFNANDFIGRMSWSIYIDFNAVRSWIMPRSL